MGPVGLLPLALVLAWLVCRRLGDLFWPDGGITDRRLGGAVLGLTLFALGARTLAHVGWVSAGLWLGLLAGLTAGLHLIRRQVRPPGLRLATLTDRASFAPAALAALAVGLAALAALWLPVWHWDSLGYHLPFVNFVLQARSIHGVPADVPYLATYPHHAEHLFLAWRLLLPDDRLIDAAQLPLGLLGAAAAAGVARRLGARPADAVAAGLLWLALPAVFLQLPSNYIDVSAAAFFLLAVYFLLAPPSRRALLLAGLALGLLLGSKPSAPVPVALLCLALLVRARRAGLLAVGLAAVGLTFAVGAESYLVNLARHGNPIWPVKVHLGPITLPGIHEMKTLLQSGASSPHLDGPLPWRLVRSWTALRPPPSFDMRIGGFGPLFLVALPAGLFLFVRRRAWLFGLALLAALAQPDPAIARYTLPLPALVFAAAAALLAARPPALRAGVWLGATTLAAVAFAFAVPGLTGDGPPLSGYARMSPAERERAVGAENPPERFIDARQRLAPGEAAAYDEAFELAYLLWRSDLANRVVRVPSDLDAAETAALLAREKVRLIVAGDGFPLGRHVAAHPEAHQKLFRCVTDACTVYEAR